MHLAEMRLTVKAEAQMREMLVKITGHMRRECLRGAVVAQMTFL